MKISLVISAIGIVVLTLAVAGCTSPQPGGAVPPGSSVATTTIPASSGCGFMNCHGLDLTCGQNPPEVCTAMYMLGDKCRQYASCSNDGGTCSLVTTPQFTLCKSCVEKCGGANPADAFSCEEKC